MTPPVSGAEPASKLEVLQAIDRNSRRFLGISGDEFLRRFRVGDYDGVDSPAVSRLVGAVDLLRGPKVSDL